VAAALVVLAGCGGGGGGGTTSTTALSQPSPSTETSVTSNSASGSESVTPPTTTETTSKSTSNEQQSGDEVPISTQALFTGRGGKITPAKIQVPPFIAVTVVLKSADGKTYSIQVKNRGVATNGTARLKLAGLRAGDRYVIKNNSGTPARLIIEANAEPGP
jgi:hypothetical protein